MNPEIDHAPLHSAGRTRGGLVLTTVGVLGAWASGIVAPEPELVLVPVPAFGPRHGDRFVGRTRGGAPIWSL